MFISNLLFLKSHQTFQVIWVPNLSAEPFTCRTDARGFSRASWFEAEGHRPSCCTWRTGSKTHRLTLNLFPMAYHQRRTLWIAALSFSNESWHCVVEMCHANTMWMKQLGVTEQEMLQQSLTKPQLFFCHEATLSNMVLRWPGQIHARSHHRYCNVNFIYLQFTSW